LRNVEERNGEQPKHEVRMPEFCGRSHPTGANDEENLGKDEIAKTEFFF